MPGIKCVSACCAALLLILSFAGCAGGGLVSPYQPPATRVTLLDGEYLSLSAWQGRVVVLGFWASWCTTSRSRLGKFGDLAEKYLDRPEVSFLAVSLDKLEDRAVVEEIFKNHGWQKLTNAFSGNDFSDEACLAFGVERVPSFYVLNKEGQVVARGNRTGFIEDVLDGLLEQKVQG